VCSIALKKNACDLLCLQVCFLTYCAFKHIDKVDIRDHGQCAMLPSDETPLLENWHSWCVDDDDDDDDDVGTRHGSASQGGRFHTAGS
jgi:hypothetical protein